MSTKGPKKSGKTKISPADILVIAVCAFAAVLSIVLFNLDLLRSINSRNNEPVGTIIIKTNIVQRRMADRLLWDRLFVDSLAYSGDLIRVAELSAATIHIDETFLELNENTLIRIQRNQNNDNAVQIELYEGNLSLSTGRDDRNTLSFMDHQVLIQPGATINASASEEGLVLSISNGTAVFTEDGRSQELPPGTIIALDAGGINTNEEEAAPLWLNAHYIKSNNEPLNIGLTWSRLNPGPNDLLRLEIARDKNFTQIIRVIEGLGASTQVNLDAGLWYWRLFRENTLLYSGYFTVTEIKGPQLISPVKDSLYLYQSDLPDLRFQWSPIEEASSYILEICETPDFAFPRIKEQTDAVFYASSSLESGIWYWRVMPVFPSVYEGSAAFTPSSFFNIKQQDIPEKVVIKMPEPIIKAPEPIKPEPAAVKITPETKPIPVQPPPQPSIEIRLTAPAAGASLAGLTALRQQTVFQWDYTGSLKKSRFVLSGNSNPLQGKPLVEINNPGKTVGLDRLTAGVYYWTVEAEGNNGIVRAASPRQIRVLEIPLLAAPENRVPYNGSHIGIQELQVQRSIVFRWSEVQGANAYIFTLSQQSPGGQRQIIRRAPENRTSWTLEDLSLLDQGTFVWQVEAVNLGRNNAIDQRGRIGENTFIVDIPSPGPVHLNEPGVLYGN